MTSTFQKERLWVYAIQSIEISEIMTETSTDPHLSCMRMTIKRYSIIKKGEVKKENLEKKFITSPADIEVHRKVELQDADITDEQ